MDISIKYQQNSQYRTSLIEMVAGLETFEMDEQ